MCMIAANGASSAVEVVAKQAKMAALCPDRGRGLILLRAKGYCVTCRLSVSYLVINLNVFFPSIFTNCVFIVCFVSCCCLCFGQNLALNFLLS